MYQMTFKGQYIEAGCMSYRLHEPKSCIYRGLNPGTEYAFIVHARAYAAGFDIVSETKEFSGSTPPNCERLNTFRRNIEAVLILTIIFTVFAYFRELSLQCLTNHALPTKKNAHSHSSKQYFLSPHLIFSYYFLSLILLNLIFFCFFQ